MKRLAPLLAAGLLGAAVYGFLRWRRPGAPPAPASAFPVFEDRAPAAGVDFLHRNFPTPEKYLIETMGGGAALLDADGDGDLDLYLVQGAPPPQDPSPRPPNRLFRNEGGLRFRDVSGESGAAGSGYGQGCAAGDADGDGDPDLFLANDGPDLFLRNLGGRFEDRTGSSGLGDRGWSTSATFLDADLDGDLDLYVARYVKVEYATHPRCLRAGRRGYCHPDTFEGLEDLFYRNEGDGTFVERGREGGVALAGPTEGKGLGVVAGDFDEDGLPDLFVANDSTPNHLYRGRGDWTYEDVALVAGVAYSAAGRAQAGMGTDAADFDGDGRLDLVVTNLNQETNTMSRNLGGGTFEDVTETSGLAAVSLPWVGFGAGFFDADDDGALDLLFVNGHVVDNVEEVDTGQTYRQPAFLMRNRGKGTFEDVSARAGPVFGKRRVGRGAAFGDLDDDGFVDVVLTSVGERVEILRNGGVPGRHWVSFRLVGARSARDGLGADLRVTAGGRTLRRCSKSGYSYLCASDPRVHVGLGDATRVDRLEVRWPSGRIDRLEGLAADRGYVLLEGREGPVP
ncbi:MAG: CRTAC1 family protein [Planctomycetes bacterium]|nr:CRTAC1 family protein [Planctomycetota bacterium]